MHHIEMFCFDENEMLRRAATECMCNLIMLEEVRHSHNIASAAITHALISPMNALF